MIDQLVRFFEQHKRAFAVVGAVWFALGCAVYARFIQLPDLPYLTEEIALYSGAAYNALWWGFVRPAFERRRHSLLNGAVQNG